MNGFRGYTSGADSGGSQLYCGGIRVCVYIYIYRVAAERHVYMGG